MANTSSEGAIENIAFEADDQCSAAVGVETSLGGQLIDEKPTGAYVVPLSQNLSKDEKPQLAEDMGIAGELKGNGF